jgi:Flp pilus assembly protein TadG
MKMRTKQAERGMAVVAATVMLVLLIPVTGLAIDVTLLYVDKARLQGAADGAALAGAESLSRGTTDAAQQLAAQQAAAEYVFLNYPSSFFFTNSVTVCYTCTPSDVQINETVANQRTVTVYAHANVPTLFMRWLNFTSTNVNASASVNRRDVNVMFVMDRSGSLQLSGSCQPAQAAGVSFLGHFALGTDNVGLITFATSSRIDAPLSTAFSGMATIINNVTCDGATSSAQALWQAYQALAALNQPSALNAIVFFTDGQPTAVTTQMTLTSNSPCISLGPFTGVFTVGFSGSSPVGTGGVFAYVAQPQPIASDDVVFNQSLANGCAFYQGGAPQWSNYWGNAYQDIAGLPTTDIWGNNLNTGYQSVGPLSNGMVTVPSNSTGAGYVIGASTNAADNAASRIRTAASPNTGGVTGETALSNVLILTIGLGNSAYPANGDLLERIANDPRGSSYNNAYPTGLYVSAPTTADLASAFAAVASEILRLAK